MSEVVVYEPPALHVRSRPQSFVGKWFFRVPGFRVPRSAFRVQPYARAYGSSAGSLVTPEWSANATAALE